MLNLDGFHLISRFIRLGIEQCQSGSLGNDLMFPIILKSCWKLGVEWNRLKLSLKFVKPKGLEVEMNQDGNAQLYHDITKGHPWKSLVNIPIYEHPMYKVKCELRYSHVLFQILVYNEHWRATKGWLTIIDLGGSIGFNDVYQTHNNPK